MANKSTGYEGVEQAARGKFYAFVRISVKRVGAGTWPTAKEAAIARDRAVAFLGIDAPVNLKSSAKLGACSPETLVMEARRVGRANRPSKYFGVTWSTRDQMWLLAVPMPQLGKFPVIARFYDERTAAIAYDQLAARYGTTPYRNFPDEDHGTATIADVRRLARQSRKTKFKHRGVTKDDGATGDRPWRANISVYSEEQGRHLKLKLDHWRSEEEAAIAYDRAALYYYGDSALLSFPKEARERGPATVQQLRTEAYLLRKKNTVSAFRGVFYTPSTKQWYVLLAKQRIGVFDDEEEAAHVYDRAALKYFGDRARPNFHPRTGEKLYGGTPICELDGQGEMSRVHETRLLGGARRRLLPHE